MNAQLLQRNVSQARCTARPSLTRCPRSGLPVRCLASSRTNQVAQQTCESQKQQKLSLSPAMQLGLLSLLSAAPALAEDAEEAVAAAAPSIQPVEIFVLLSPLILYGLFNVYRDNVNPRAKLSDFFFILAGFAIVSNIVSILVFKMRLF